GSVAAEGKSRHTNSFGIDARPEFRVPKKTVEERGQILRSLPPKHEALHQPPGLGAGISVVVDCRNDKALPRKIRAEPGHGGRRAPSAVRNEDEGELLPPLRECRVSRITPR